MVTFQKIEELDFGEELRPREFAQLGARVGEGQAGAYQWGEKYFELTAADPAQLATYALRAIPDGQMFPISNVQTSERELSTGLIVWDEKVVNVTQVFDDDYNVQLLVQGEPYILLPATGVNVTPASLQPYRTRNGNIPFMVNIVAANPRVSPLMGLGVNSLDGRVPYYFGRVPNETVQKVLLPDNQVIYLTVLNSTNGVVNIK